MDAVPENIERFNRTALVVLDMLYDAFPTPLQFSPMHIGRSAMPEAADPQQAFDYAAQARHAVAWLTEEGFIRHAGGSSMTNRSVFEAQLTLKGLTVLGYLPTALQPDEAQATIIDRIKQVLAHGIDEASAETIRSILSEALKLAWRHGLRQIAEPR